MIGVLLFSMGLVLWQSMKQRVLERTLALSAQAKLVFEGRLAHGGSCAVINHELGSAAFVSANASGQCPRGMQFV